MKSVCVFCGASAGKHPAYREAARVFGENLAREGVELVWGAGNVGLMGAVADAVVAAGGRSYGVIPDFMVERELAHPAATELHVVRSMHERKAMMAERADAFVALPGGFGTLDELFEILTWAQLHLHAKPIGLFNARGFFDPLRDMVKHMVGEGFVNPKHEALLYVDDDAPRLLAALRGHRPPEGDWVGEKLSVARG